MSNSRSRQPHPFAPILWQTWTMTLLLEPLARRRRLVGFKLSLPCAITIPITERCKKIFIYVRCCDRWLDARCFMFDIFLVVCFDEGNWFYEMKWMFGSPHFTCKAVLNENCAGYISKGIVWHYPWVAFPHANERQCWTRTAPVPNYFDGFGAAAFPLTIPLLELFQAGWQSQLK